MRLFSKFDRSSKVLLFISLFGILTSIYALYYTYSNEELDEDALGESIARVSFSTADTRIKRSGNIHWYSVEEPVRCFRNDLVFTGDNSTATIEFAKGDKVHLLPNSLVSISDQLITLESGAIEVDLKGKEIMSIQSFGEVVKLSEKTKFRVIKNNNENKVIGISGRVSARAATIAQAKKTGVVAKPEKIEEFVALSPRPGMLIPHFEDYRLTFDWTYSGPDQKFKLVINQKKYDLTTSHFTLPVRELEAGKVTWTVTNAQGRMLKSEFEVTDIYQIKLQIPEDAYLYTINAQSQLVDFAWLSSVSYQQKIQIATDESFQNVVSNQEINSNSFQKMLDPGKYFWRVGYVEDGKPLYWSALKSFEVKKQPVIVPKISLQLVPENFDFSLSPVHTFQVILSHPMKNIQYTLKGPNTNVTAPVQNQKFGVSGLEDGKYSLILSGEKDGKRILSFNYVLNVKNAKPLEAPKIQGKKVKLFVRILKKLSEFIIPSAHAEDTAFYPLKWDAKGGELFEVEITSEDKSKVILKEQIKSESYNFLIPQPGTFNWRVRQQKDGTWGPFSAYTEIIVGDKVTLLDKPLMKKASVTGEEFTFEWDEPYPDLTYTLNIYRGNAAEPITSIPVQGGKKTLTIQKDNEKIYWRVAAVSSHANENKNRKKFLVTNSQLPTIKETILTTETPNKNTQYILRTRYLQINNSYEQESGDTDLSTSNTSRSLAGSDLLITGEAWKNKYGLILGIRRQTTSSGDTEYNETEYLGELGYQWKKFATSTHQLAVGYLLDQTEVHFTSTDGEYSRAFLTFRHQYERFLGQKYAFAMSTTLLQPLQTDIIPPSVRLLPAFNWYFKPKWWVSFIAGYEMNRANLFYSASAGEGKLKVSSDIMMYGLSLNWKSF